MVICPAAPDLSHALVEWGTAPITIREGDRRSKLGPSQRAMVALAYLREHTTPAKIAAGFGIRESTAHACTSAVVDLLDGALAECDRVGDGRPATPTTPAPRRERAAHHRPRGRAAVSLTPPCRAAPTT